MKDAIIDALDCKLNAHLPVAASTPTTSPLRATPALDTAFLAGHERVALAQTLREKIL